MGPIIEPFVGDERGHTPEVSEISSVPNTHMVVVSARRQFSLKRLPLDAQDPPFVAGERVRWGFRE